MRATILVTAICFSLASLATAADAEASMKRATDIPPQPLAPALQRLVTESDIQLVYRSELIADLKTNGANGVLTPIETLSQLLSGTGLTYRYLDDKTVTILPLPSGNRAAIDPSAERAAGDTSVRPADKDETPPAAKEAQKASFWDRFRVAQVDQGQASNDRSVEYRGDEQASKVKLEEIIVTAQKREERLQDVPLPVTAINGESLATINQTRLEDYYTRIPGLSLTTVQPFGSSTLAIRGVVTGLYQSPTVGIVVDDVPYTSSTTVGFGNAVSDFDPSDLSRVEVLRGPQGTLYGASSMGGLIKYVTVDPSTDSTSGRIQGGISNVSNGNELGYNVRGAVNVPISDAFAIRASAFTRRDPGYIDDPANNEEAVNWGQTSGGRLSAMWRPSEDVSVKLSALLQDSKVHGSAEVDAIPGLGDLAQNRVPNSGGYHKSFQVYSANLSAKLGNVDLTAVSAYATNKNKFMWDFSGQLGGLARDGIPGFFTGFGVDGVTSTQDVKTNKFTQEVRFSMPIGQKAEWLFGAFYGREKTPRNLQTVPVVEFTTNEPVGELAHLIYLNTLEEYAAFTDLTFHFTDRFDVQVGGRESQNKQDFQNITGGALFSGDGGADNVQPESHSKDNAFTYLVTPRFKVSEDLMAYARLASGYRPGGPNGGVALNSAFPTEYGPDKTQSYEIGVKGNVLDHAFSFDISLYYINWKNIQLQLTDPVTFLTYYDNAGRARSKGLELSIEARPAAGLTIAASGSWGDAELTEDFPSTAGSAQAGDRLPFSSRFSGNVSLDDEFQLAANVLGFVGGSVSYVGDRPSAIGSPGPQNYPSYTKTDLRAGVRYDTWTMTLFGNNVTDKRGVLNAKLPTAFTYIQPRTVGLSLTKTL